MGFMRKLKTYYIYTLVYCTSMDNKHEYSTEIEYNIYYINSIMHGRELCIGNDVCGVM